MPYFQIGTTDYVGQNGMLPPVLSGKPKAYANPASNTNWTQVAFNAAPTAPNGLNLRVYASDATTLFFMVIDSGDSVPSGTTADGRSHLLPGGQTASMDVSWFPGQLVYFRNA